MEDVLGNSSFLVNSFPLESIFESSSEGDKFPLGFLELLGAQYFTSPPLFDIAHHVPSLVTDPPIKIESPDAFNLPATSNSSSISSASSEAVNDESVKVGDQEEDQQKPINSILLSLPFFYVLLKAKKTNQKRQRKPRFAFMTKSEVDHLEDGYKWRKYGQKACADVTNRFLNRGRVFGYFEFTVIASVVDVIAAVTSNSDDDETSISRPKSRSSYYRCISTSCNVKKRVERSFTDPNIVVTTYEGQHTHPSPLVPHTSLGGSHLNSGISAGAVFGMSMQRAQPHFYRQQIPFSSALSPLLKDDHGLLQDFIPSHMLKEE
ncbi:Detected protein of unknown function [Hibiscus syriacus]|uniref:WRKY domain-containing protein n=1 Tax=Hibiscus syriacus TaxID=106335 RepID=A0A6A2WHQ6_HIBSY|nr:Detected protein of unknown function [Hibiscus syriacus]